MQVVAFGTIFLELVFGHVDHLPGPGEEIFTDQFATSCGGAVSIASAASSVGASTGLGVVLSDDLGSYLVEKHCAEMGIDTSTCKRIPGPTSGITVVMNFDEDRAFVSHLPIGLDQESAAANSWWREVVERERPDWIYLHARPGILPFLEDAHRAGCLIALDTEMGGIGRHRQDVLECIAVADLFLPNHRELLQLAETTDLDSALQTVSDGTTPVVVKHGPEGAVLALEGKVIQISGGIRRVEVLDRTGAGDAFAGAIIGSLAQGATLVDAVIAGNNAGSDAVARLGALGEVTWRAPQKGTPQ